MMQESGLHGTYTGSSRQNPVDRKTRWSLNSDMQLGDHHKKPDGDCLKMAQNQLASRVAEHNSTMWGLKHYPPTTKEVKKMILSDGEVGKSYRILKNENEEDHEVLTRGTALRLMSRYISHDEKTRFIIWIKGHNYNIPSGMADKISVTKI